MGKKRRRKSGAPGAASGAEADAAGAATPDAPAGSKFAAAAPAASPAPAAAAAAADTAAVASAAAQDATAKKKAKPAAGVADSKKRGGAGDKAAAAAAAAAAAPADPEAERIANQRKLQKMVIRMRAKGKSDKEIRKAKIEFKREVSLKLRIADPTTTPRAEPKQKKLTAREQHVAEWKERNQPEAAVKGKKHNLVIVPVLWRNKEEESADILAACATIKKYLSSFGLDVWIDERTKCVRPMRAFAAAPCIPGVPVPPFSPHTAYLFVYFARPTCNNALTAALLSSP
jgi:hypothetical protein